MKSCEFCEGLSVSLLKNKMESNLIEKGIGVNYFIESNPKTRLNIIRRKFNLEKEKISDNLQKGEFECFKNGDYGFLVVKPEMYESSNKIEKFLSRRIELDILYKRDFVYLPEQYWLIYGKSLLKNFEGFPHGALIFLIGITLPSKIFIFRHHSIDVYKRLYKLLNKNKDPNLLLKEDYGDKQYIFCKLFAKNGENSIRNSICLTEMSKKGFLKMEENKCPAICWDFTSSFRKREIKENIYTFNGIHTPKNNKELLSEIAVLSELI